MRRRFLQRKDPIVPQSFRSVILIVKRSDSEDEDDDEHEEESPISEFRFKFASLLDVQRRIARERVPTSRKFESKFRHRSLMISTPVHFRMLLCSLSVFFWSGI